MPSIPIGGDDLKTRDMKIVIAGAGEVGCHLAKMLSEGYHDITIIDSDESRLATVSETMDVLTILGSPTSVEVLRGAAVDKADLFVAVCPAKEQDVNLVSAAIAKKLGARKVTARINNEEYLSNDNRLIFKDLGIDLLFCPERIAASEITGLLRQSEMSEFMDFARGRLQLISFKLSENSPLVDKSMKDMYDYPLESPSFRIVAIARGDETIIPKKSTLFKAFDLIFIIARQDAVGKITAFSGRQDIDIRRLVILGGGRIGEIVAREFSKEAEFIKIIELNKARCAVLAERLGDKVLVVNGDGRNSDFLYEEDVRTCDAFVAVTSSSETNIMACVAARKMGVPKTIAEVENLEYISLAEEMGIDSVINKKLTTAGRIFRFTLSDKVRTIKCLNGSDADVIEYIVNPDSPITKAPIRDLNFPDGAVIGGIVRGSETIIAVGDTLIKPYDRVAVFALPEAVKKVEKFFT